MECGTCNKRCDEAEVVFDVTHKVFLISAKCHGEADQHVVTVKELEKRKGSLILRPFSKSKS
jgi:hypothetical protein